MLLVQTSKNKTSISIRQFKKFYKDFTVDGVVKVPFNYLYDLVNENNDKEIKFLLNNNVKIYCNNVSKFIKKTENTEIIEYLKKFNVEGNIYNRYFNIEEILSSCFYEEDYETLNFLVEQGVNFDKYEPNDYNGRPLFATECENNNIEAIKFLTEHGANINIKDNYEGKSGLIILINNNDYHDIDCINEIKYLIDHGVEFYNNRIAITNQYDEEEKK